MIPSSPNALKKKAKPGSTPLITLDHISFTYSPSQPLLRDFSWQLGDGESWAILGPTGCGKTSHGANTVKWWKRQRIKSQCWTDVAGLRPPPLVYRPAKRRIRYENPQSAALGTGVQCAPVDGTAGNRARRRTVSIAVIGRAKAASRIGSPTGVRDTGVASG